MSDIKPDTKIKLTLKNWIFIILFIGTMVTGFVTWGLTLSNKIDNQIDKYIDVRNDVSECQENYGLVKDLLIEMRTDIKWIKESIGGD